VIVYLNLIEFLTGVQQDLVGISLQWDSCSNFALMEFRGTYLKAPLEHYRYAQLHEPSRTL
jgi:hypothetical protein